MKLSEWIFLAFVAALVILGLSLNSDVNAAEPPPPVSKIQSEKAAQSFCNLTSMGLSLQIMAGTAAKASELEAEDERLKDEWFTGTQRRGMHRNALIARQNSLIAQGNTEQLFVLCAIWQSLRSGTT